MDLGERASEWLDEKLGGKLTVGGVDLFEVARQLKTQIDRDDVPGLAAELSYRFFLALFPFFVFIAALSGFVAAWLNLPDPTGLILDAFGQAVPTDAEILVRPQIEFIIATQRPGLLSFGFVVAIWAATGGTKAIMKAMDRAYDVEETRSLIHRDITATWMTLLGSALLITAFVLFVAGQTAGLAFADAIGAGVVFSIFLLVLSWVGPVVLLGLAMIFTYRLAPNLILPFRWITPGSLLFAVGWTVATYAFTLYAASFADYGAMYGALGGIVVLLLWFYLTSFILLIGAEVNAIVDDLKAHDELDRQRHEKHDERERREREKRERRERRGRTD